MTKECDNIEWHTIDIERLGDIVVEYEDDVFIQHDHYIHNNGNKCKIKLTFKELENLYENVKNDSNVFVLITDEKCSFSIKKEKLVRIYKIHKMNRKARLV